MHCTTMRIISNTIPKALHQYAYHKQCNPNALYHDAYRKQFNSYAMQNYDYQYNSNPLAQLCLS